MTERRQAEGQGVTSYSTSKLTEYGAEYSVWYNSVTLYTGYFTIETDRSFFNRSTLFYNFSNRADRQFLLDRRLKLCAERFRATEKHSPSDIVCIKGARGNALVGDH